MLQPDESASDDCNKTVKGALDSLEFLGRPTQALRAGFAGDLCKFVSAKQAFQNARWRVYISE